MSQGGGWGVGLHREQETYVNELAKNFICFVAFNVMVENFIFLALTSPIKGWNFYMERIL